MVFVFHYKVKVKSVTYERKLTKISNRNKMKCYIFINEGWNKVACIVWHQNIDFLHHNKWSVYLFVLYHDFIDFISYIEPVYHGIFLCIWETSCNWIRNQYAVNLSICSQYAIKLFMSLIFSWKDCHFQIYR